MSTEVVLATHSDGVLRCYHRAADGAMSQTAQITAGAEIEPSQLATVVSDLSTLFDWSNLGASIRPNGRALESSATPALESGRLSDAESAERRNALLDLIREHPNETSGTLGSLLLGETASPVRRDAVRKRLDRLVQLGEVVRHRPSTTAHWRYRIAATPTAEHTGETDENYRKRPRASHTERQRRRDVVLAYLHEHPHSTATDVGTAVFSDVPQSHRTGKARSVLEQLEILQLVKRTEHADHPLTFAPIYVAPPEPQPETESG